MAKKSIIDTPLNEITLRRYEKPENLSRRDIAKKLCLSMGLLQPGDSRDVIVDILLALIDAKKHEKVLTSERIKEIVIDKRGNSNLPLIGVASSNVRRQLKRLRNLFLVEKIKNNYRITEFSSLTEIFDEKIKQYLLPSIISRVKEYLDAAEHI